MDADVSLTVARKVEAGQTSKRKGGILHSRHFTM